MNHAGLTHGEAGDVADHLMGAEDVDVSALTGALINALYRIARLEARVDELERRNDREDNYRQEQNERGLPYC